MKWTPSQGQFSVVISNINACKTRFKLGNENITLVFDRGIISDDNAILINDAEMKYISALDRNQIPSCGVSLEPFKGLSADKDTEKVSTPSGFKKYDNEMYFCDSGVIGNKRLIIGFNPTLFKEDRTNRDEKISFFKTYLKKESNRPPA